MPLRKQLYAQIDAGLYNQLVAYKNRTGKSMRQILEEALKMLFKQKPQKPLKGEALVKAMLKHAHDTGKKEDIVSKIDEIVYGPF